MKRFALLALLFTGTHLFLAINASDGTLDPSFGGSGTGYLTVQNVASGFECYAMAIQTDGKIVTASSTQIVRLSPNGSPDTAFGPAGTGVVTTTLAGIFALLIQPDGSIVACGYDSSLNGVLTRYTSAGIIDNSFGTSGNGVATAPALVNCDLYSMVQQADGKIVVGGGNIDTFANVVMRFTANGSPDVVFETSPSPTVRGIVGLVVQADGNIVALTGSQKQQATGSIYLVRYYTDGSIDKTFGMNGLATGPAGIIGANNGLVIQPDGKLLVGGKAFVGSTPLFQVTRFDTQGNLDSSFNGTGFNNNVPGSYCNTILLQADGAIVLAGSSPAEFWQLTRYTSTGIVDSSFGNDGTAIGPVISGDTFSIAVQADGNIVIGGKTSSPASAFVARYLSNPALVTTTVRSPIAAASVNTPTTFTGQAQDPSLVFLLIDGVPQPQGTHTDPNNWSITATAKTVGTHTAQAISIYQDGNLNIASDPITFVVGPQAPSSFTGTITKNEFLNKTECVLQAAFTQSPNAQTAQYIVAQNGVTIAVIPATQLVIPATPSFKGNNVLNNASKTTIANMVFDFVLCGSCKGNAFNGITVSAATASGIVGAPQPLVIT
ncbi:MAG: delta-60 repeat domain-containing protein [Candidatus Babeliales bacterium]